MKTWIVTGGAATGKSAFCKMVLALEPTARLASSDVMVHELLSDLPTAQTVAGMFGADVLEPSGEVNRAVLRSKVFVSETARKDLEALLHPLVYTRLEKARILAASDGVQLFIAEIPLFYEGSRNFPADRVILVAADDASQLRRMMETRGLDTSTAQSILAAQLPLARKLELATTVVWNEGSLELLHSQAQLLLQSTDP
ncbi:MAG: dephospho-CoA kinase [Verrucomicrobia bacterium]|nr:dephospho-CoA kinase [Verrucomicrobiota bacterium]